MTRAKEHAGLADIASRILACAELAGTQYLTEVARLRLALAKAVAAHVECEVKDLPSLNGKGVSPAIRDLVTRYHGDLLAWRHALMACNASWPIARIRTEPADFVADFTPIYQALLDRIRWEESVFFPSLLAVAADERKDIAPQRAL